uniref:Uncharacterized protein n=1 Tax=Ganoderma calidophilum TaxID=2026244 RepID=A0A2S1WBM2_9APHY|nr:hypothetical protein [Ganoderma calidophilum]AWJ63974.1 hypothetical protein [Ganoderma calidophilum]
MKNLQVKIIYISQIRTEHQSSVLNKKQLIDQIQEVDTESLLDGLEEIKKYSEQMAASEYIEKTTTPFKEAFPNFYKDEKIKQFFEKKQLEGDFYNSALSTDSIDNASHPEIVVSVKEAPGINILERIFNFTLNNRNPIDDSLDQKLNKPNKIKCEEINEEYRGTFKPELSQLNESQKLIESKPEGSIVIDTNKVSEAWDKLSKTFSENIDKVEVGGTLCLFGLSQVLMYKGIMKAYDNNHKLDLDKFKTDKAKLLALRHQQYIRIRFSTYWSLIVMSGIYSMFAIHKMIKPNNNININISNTSSNDKPDLSFIILGTYFKLLPKWLRLFIKFIFLPIIFHIGYSYFLRDILSFYNGIFFIKLFISLIIGFNILIDIFILCFISKCSKFNKMPMYSKFIPSFFKNKLIDLYEISQLDKNERDMLVNDFIKSLLILTILFLISIIILLVDVIFI